MCVARIVAVVSPTDSDDPDHLIIAARTQNSFWGCWRRGKTKIIAKPVIYNFPCSDPTLTTGPAYSSASPSGGSSLHFGHTPLLLLCCMPSTKDSLPRPTATERPAKMRTAQVLILLPWCLMVCLILIQVDHGVAGELAVIEGATI